MNNFVRDETFDRTIKLKAKVDSFIQSEFGSGKILAKNLQFILVYAALLLQDYLTEDEMIHLIKANITANKKAQEDENRTTTH